MVQYYDPFEDVPQINVEDDVECNECRQFSLVAATGYADNLGNVYASWKCEKCEHFNEEYFFGNRRED